MTIGVQDRNKITVGVIRGGPSNEYDVSLRTGGEILKNMPDKYRVQDIFISRDGAWHIGGLERPPERILSQVDVVFNALHGRYGEDGKLQRTLEKICKGFSKGFPSLQSLNPYLLDLH